MTEQITRKWLKANGFKFDAAYCVWTVGEPVLVDGFITRLELFEKGGAWRLVIVQSADAVQSWAEVVERDRVVLPCPDSAALVRLVAALTEHQQENERG